MPIYRENYPALHQGLLCCNQRAKGEVILAFLNHARLNPGTLVHIDDSIEELASTELALNASTAKTICLHYKKADEIKHPHWNIWAGLRQLKALINNQGWVADQPHAASDSQSAALP